jgi:dipeptidyl aminopeptidase/acylaminoacyl peptidase
MRTADAWAVVLTLMSMYSGGQDAAGHNSGGDAALQSTGPQTNLKRELDIATTLALRRPSGIAISPHGDRVAYVVTQPQLKTNQDHAVLYVAPTASRGRGLVLSEAIHITTVRWSRDAQWIFFVSETRIGRGIWRVPATGGKVKPLALADGALAYVPEYEGGSDPYVVSPDGGTLFYGVYDTAAARHKVEAEMETGVVYGGEAYYQFRLCQCSKSLPAPFQLWSYDLKHGRTQELWHTPGFTPRGFWGPEFQLSPDGKRIALLYQATNDPRYVLALLDLTTQKITPQLSNLGVSSRLKWNDSGQSLSFDSFGIRPRDGQPPPEESHQFTFDLTDRSIKPSEGEKLAVGVSGDAVAKAVEERAGDLLHNCSLDVAVTHAACVRESPMSPPEVVTVTLRGGVPRDDLRVLTHLNPEYDTITLGAVISLNWSDKKSNEGDAQAGLILPVDYIPGTQYPLLVVLYNVFTGRRFIADAEGLTSYPAQAFAGHGYAVLLMNCPEGWGAYKYGDFSAAKTAEVDAVVSAVRSGVDLLIERGIADPKRMGIMGWSYGAFWTDYIVTHHPDWFQAAASGEGGNHEPGVYWLFDERFRSQERGFFGGGPDGKFYSRWKEIAPVLSADRLRAPLLMEYLGVNVNGLQMRTAILEQGGQAELVMYPDDDHVLQRPLNRYNSMTRHFDWFNFWLLGEEDPAPGKQQQYARWRELKAQHERRECTRTRGKDPVWNS